MDNTAQSIDTPVEEIQEPAFQGEIPHTSPFKRFLPFVIIGFVVLMLLSVVLFLFASRKAPKQTGSVTPTIRPTATPIVTQRVTSEPAINTDTLYFIRSGDIYAGDFNTASRVVKNEIPAGDKLIVSSDKKHLAWRPKSETGIPSAITRYDAVLQKTATVQDNPPGEIIDFTWDPIGLQLGFVSYDGSLYTIGVSGSETRIQRAEGMKQIFWLKEDTLLFTGNDGIGQIDLGNASPSATLLVTKPNIIRAALSPDKKNLLYSAGVIKKSDLFILSLESNTEQTVNPIPASVDMGGSGVSPEALSKGFIPYALWFPDGKRLLVGYQHLPNMPLVGIYDLTISSFTALGAFALYVSDQITRENQLVGVRSQLGSGTPSWNLMMFSLEKNSPFAVLHTIPDASSPAYLP